MAVQNKLAGVPDKAIEYEVNGEKVKLSPGIIRNYLVSGNGNVSNQEIVMFLNLCKFQHLNPFLREAYLIKFGSSPASIVTGKEVFTKRARRNKDYAGQQAGVIVLKKDGELENRIGTLVLKDKEELVGGWAKVFIKEYAEPVEITVSLDEYIGRKSDGEVNSQWAKKPATMIRKVALVQALREAFPEDFAGMYSQEEIQIDGTLDETPVDENAVIEAKPIEEPVQEQQELSDDPLA